MISKSKVIDRQGYSMSSPRAISERANKLQIKIKYFSKDLVPIQKISIGDWIDLRCAEDIKLKKGDYAYIPLGVAMQLPEGYEAWLTSRSSMAKRYKIIHCDDLGVIDNSFCGDNDEWKLPVFVIDDTEIKKNERICQFRLAKTQPELEIIEVDYLGNPDRGGCGSTGTM